MRGFVLSIVSLLLLALLFAMATSLHDHYLRMERSLTLPQPISYSAYTIGSAASALNSIVGPDITIGADNSSLSIIIMDNIPMENLSGDLSDYSSMLSGPLADQTHANISADFSDISDGSYGVLINRRYAYSNSESGDMLFRAASGPTNASAYDISVSVAEYRANVTHFGFVPGGDINVTLRYTDLNGTIAETGQVSSAGIDRFRVEYSDGGTLEIGLGRASASEGALWIVARNATAQASWGVSLPPPSAEDRIGYEYGAPMNCSIGASSISRPIGT